MASHQKAISHRERLPVVHLLIQATQALQFVLDEKGHNVGQPDWLFLAVSEGRDALALRYEPNLQAHMAASPELLAGYSALWDLFSKSSLTAHEQQVVYLTSNFENDCHYCMAGHTTLAKMQKMDPAVIDALRAGTPLPDRKLKALHRFATKVVRNRGWVSDTEIEAFLAAGYAGATCRRSSSASRPR